MRLRLWYLGMLVLGMALGQLLIGSLVRSLVE